MIDKVEFGKVETTEVIDNDTGSLMTATENMHEGKLVLPVRRRYHIKVRVYNQKEQDQAYVEFSRQLSGDTGMLEPEFKTERNRRGDDNGYWYAVKCYTRLEY